MKHCQILWALLFAILVVAGRDVAFAAEPADKPIPLCTKDAVDVMDFFLDNGGKKEDVFRVTTNGELEITGAQNGYLATKEHYRNFVVRGQFRMPDPKIATNSGFLVRITGPSPTGTFLPRCVELQCMRGLSGDLFGFHGLVIKGNQDRYVTGKQHEFAGDYCHVKKYRNAEKPGPDDWNSFELTCFEDLILVRINGQIVNWSTGVESVAGPVAFQSEGGPARFRNVTITPLP